MKKLNKWVDVRKKQVREVTDMDITIKKLEEKSKDLVCECGSILNSENNFCGSCGKKVEIEDNYLIECTRCNSLNEEDSVYCACCGIKL